MGTFHYFLNMDSHHRLKGLFFTQQRLLKTNMLQTKPISSPMSSAQKLSVFLGNPCPDQNFCRSTMGAPQYLWTKILSNSNELEGIQMQNLSLTRLDISFVVRFIWSKDQIADADVCVYLYYP
jgi:hypothetical protein